MNIINYFTFKFKNLIIIVCTKIISKLFINKLLKYGMLNLCHYIFIGNYTLL